MERALRSLCVLSRHHLDVTCAYAACHTSPRPTSHFLMRTIGGLLSRANYMHSDAASQGGGWWQGCGAAYIASSSFPVSPQPPSFA